MSATPEKSENGSLKINQKSPETNKSLKRKLSHEESDETIDNSSAEVQVLPSTSDDTPGPSKVMKKANLPSQLNDKTEVPSSSSFFDRKKDIAETKHGILSYYLKAWLPISSYSAVNSGTVNFPLVYIDGFAGPGRYKENDETGSPLVAYNLALNHTNLPMNGPQIYMIFIEMKKEHSENLLTNLKNEKEKNREARNGRSVKYMVINDEFVPAMYWILSDAFTFVENTLIPKAKVPKENLSSSNHQFFTQNTPLFVFVDPFGYSGKDIPMKLMQQILKTIKKAEILINLMTGFLQRFVDVPSRLKAINLLVGQDECDSTWKPIVEEDESENGIEKMKKFLDHYHDKISEISKRKTFVVIFEMRNNRNHLLYNLFHVCQHSSAFKHMKKSMRKCSQSDLDFKYSSFKAKDGNLKRETLEVEKLAQEIVQYYKNHRKFRGKTISGAQITQLIDSDPNLYQRYKNQLKKYLEEYRTNKKNKFDEMTFNFYLPGDDILKK